MDPAESELTDEIAPTGEIVKLQLRYLSNRHSVGGAIHE
jgi:hypothetical protein